MGIMFQKNSLHELFCSSWPAYQYTELCKKIHIVRIQPLRKVIYHRPSVREDMMFV
jgi:hypothetical protein